MSTHKLYLESKRIQQRAIALSGAGLTGKEKIKLAEELLKEIDDLAVLLDQVKKQSDRIQAMADAIGDSIIDSTNRTICGSSALVHGRSKSEFSTAARVRPRLRLETFPAASSAPGAER